MSTITPVSQSDHHSYRILPEYLYLWMGGLLFVQISFTIYMFCKIKRETESLAPSLSKRFIENIVIGDKFQHPPLPYTKFATGIFRIPAADFNPVTIDCIYKGETVFTKSLSLSTNGKWLEAVLLDMPHREKVTLSIGLKQFDVEVSEELGIYVLINGRFEVSPLNAFQPTICSTLGTPIDTICGIHIRADKKLRFFTPKVQEEAYEITIPNRSRDIFLLFFRIVSRQGDYLIPAVAFPGTTTYLPRGFLLEQWRTAYVQIHKRQPPQDLQLQIASLADTSATLGTQA